jgi:hypothetical protein
MKIKHRIIDEYAPKRCIFLTEKADHRYRKLINYSWKYRLNLLRRVVFIKENLFLIQKLFILRLLDTIGSQIAFFLNKIKHRIIDEYAPKRCIFLTEKADHRYRKLINYALTWARPTLFIYILAH